MAFLGLKNHEGKFVAPEAKAFQAAAASADWENAEGYYLILTDQAGAASWPITGASFIIMYRQPKDPAAASEALKFFAWAYKNGSDLANQLDYVPLPGKLAKLVKNTSTPSIQGPGKPSW